MSKKIILSFALILGTMIFAQDYYDTYPQDYNGYEYYDNSYDYPDNYYYNYPTDYYPDQYYQGYYNDYQRAVFSVNWNNFFVEYHLSPFQINQIMILNNRFESYDAWNAYYRWNPDRWYYDRFFALQNILGPRIFVVYQNAYFRGRSPIMFYRNRCVNFYATRYPVRPVYRNVNINIYRVDRNNFRDGFRNPPRNSVMIDPRNNNGGVRNVPPRSGANGNSIDGIRNSQNGGIRNPQNGGVRNDQNSNVRNYGGVRGGNRSDNNVRLQPSPNTNPERTRNLEGMRQNQNYERKAEIRTPQRNFAPRSEGGNNRSLGNRFVSR